MKECYTCKEKKQVEDFYKDSSKNDGLSYQCKSCLKKRHTKWRESNPDKISLYKKNWAESNPDKIRAASRKYQRKQMNENRSSFNEKSVKMYRHIKNKVTDGYVKMTIVGGLECVGRNDVPAVLVELKRNEIKAERKIQSKNDEGHK